MKPDSNRRATGARAEQHAADYLAEAGYAIIARNWRCRSGELDIVALLDGTLVIVEVRSRRDGRFGDALESVEWRKQAQVRQTAVVFMQQTNRHSVNVRFDVIAVALRPEDGAIAELRHVEAAF